MCRILLLRPFFFPELNDLYLGLLNIWAPVPAAARSKAWVCGRSLAEIVGSNPTGGMHVCLL